MLMGQMRNVINLVDLVPVPYIVLRTSIKPQAEAYQQELLLGNNSYCSDTPSKFIVEPSG